MQHDVPQPIAVLDAGCGSGLLGQHFKQTASAEKVEVLLAGIDLSPEMLAVAKAKECYDNLAEANLKQPLEFPPHSFDLIIAAGVFLPGHCGPEAVPFMLAPLKDGGLGVFTVREALFAEKGEAFKSAVDEAGCDLLEAELLPYYGEIQANVLVVKKRFLNRCAISMCFGIDTRFAAVAYQLIPQNRCLAGRKLKTHAHKHTQAHKRTRTRAHGHNVLFQKSFGHSKEHAKGLNCCA